MRRYRAGRLWLTAACAVVACLAMSASALATPGSLEWGKCTKVAGGGKYSNGYCTKLAKPGKEGWEWAPLSTSVKFTSSKAKETGPAVYSVGGNEVSCTAAGSKEGEYNAPKEVSNVVLEFSGCEVAGFNCQSP